MHTDENCAAYDGSNTSAQCPVQHDRKRFVDDDVRQEQGDEYPVFSFVEQVENSLRALMLRFGDIASEDLKINAVLAHQPTGSVSNCPPTLQ